MDKVIVTALLIIAGVAAAGLVVTTLTPIIGSSSRSVVESQKNIASRIATDIKVIAVHPENSSTLKVMVKNVGTENINSVEQSDVYVSDIDGSRFVPLVHGSGSSDNWSVDSGDMPIWAQGKTVALTVRLSSASALESSHGYFLNFSTPNGVASQYRFKYTAP